MNDDATYGNRFLDAWKRDSGSLGSFDYASIQRMKAADREEFVAVLREHSPYLSYAAIRLIRECEPEEAARTMFAQAQQANQTALLVFLAMS